MDEGKEELNAESSNNSTINKGDECQLSNNNITITIKTLLKKEVRSSHYENIIFRVPKQLRNLNPAAYTPQSVSIGPLHHNDERLQPMNKLKLQYLQRFLDRHYEKTLDVYVEAVSKLEESARKCYSETKDLDKNKFIEMMVIDCCFILELLEIKVKGEKDEIVSNRSWLWEVDLINLENQLPFFVLERLYNLIYKPQTPNTFSLVIYEGFLDGFGAMLHGPSFERLKSLPLPRGGAKYFVHLLQSVLVGSSMRRSRDSERRLLKTSCASELQRAGVKFQKESSLAHSPNTSLFDITFDKGVLTIPTIQIYDETEYILRNLIAYEQGQDDIIYYFTAYAAFMDGLIDTYSDSELLEAKGIIENNLGNPQEVVTLFNNIVKQVVIKDAYFSDVIGDVERYHNKSWNKWKASLLQNYFNTPWALISFLAAVFLLILTVVQTIFSILQVV